MPAAAPTSEFGGRITLRFARIIAGVNNRCGAGTLQNLTTAGRRLASEGREMQGNRSYLVLFATTAWLFFCPAVLAVTSIASESSNPESAAAADRKRMARRIDDLLAAEWKAAGVAPAPTASDGEFLRRAYLDLTGVIPRVSEVREFLADERPDKRERLVARTVGVAALRDAHGHHLAKPHPAARCRPRAQPRGSWPAKVVAHAIRQEPALRQSRGRAAAGDRRRRAGARALLPSQRSVAGKTRRQRGRIVSRR